MKTHEIDISSILPSPFDYRIGIYEEENPGEYCKNMTLEFFAIDRKRQIRLPSDPMLELSYEEARQLANSILSMLPVNQDLINDYSYE